MAMDFKDSSTYLPYGRQLIDEGDIRAVEEVLCSDWLTTGPMVGRFEKAVADFVEAEYCVAVSSGTAALHAAMHAIGIGPGDEVVVPAITFVATANSVIYQGGTPVFADVEADTLLLDPVKVEEKITSKTKAVIAVDYAGQPCDYEALKEIASRHDLVVVADACHALGGQYRGKKVGTVADLTVFSFHPVKHVTTAEGGAVVTDSLHYAEKARIFRNHGITSDHLEREKKRTWYYEMTELGFNYRLSDLQCALGVSQLRRLSEWLGRREEIAVGYDRALAEMPVLPLKKMPGARHAYHLYVIRIDPGKAGVDRDSLFERMRAENIGVNVHYMPVYMHPYYQSRQGGNDCICPEAEKAYNEILTLPIHQGMSDRDLERVVVSLKRNLQC